jgi:hypothetical protein
MTESKRMALGYGPDQSRRFENRPTKSQYASSSNLHRGYDPYQQQEQRAYHGGHESNFNSAAKPTSSRRQMIPAAPIQLISSNERQKLTNPNINNKDFNPITHTNGYRQEGTFAQTSKDYGKIPSRQVQHPAGLVAPNTTAGNNKIF